MHTNYFRILTLALLFTACSGPKETHTSIPPLSNNLRAHIEFLADDKLEGRRTGSEGEEKAMKYIMEQFKKAGLTPKGIEYYPQNFIVDDGKQMGEGTLMTINGSKLEKEKDFFVFPFSPDRRILAKPSPALQELGVPWFFDLKETLEQNKENPHFDINEFIHTNYKGIEDRGATAVVFYNSSVIDDKLKFEPKNKMAETPIPYVYINKEAAKKYLADPAATIDIKLESAIDIKNRVGHNVIGFINNSAATTVVLGAHYDHLGYGEDGNSRNTSHEKAIHNGADDNASGTAALIELASLLMNSKAKNNNYLFIAFSGEELGLFGSKYFVENPTIDLKSINFMINMDMVGRLNDSSRSVTIGGYGTSPDWSTVISKDYFEISNDTKKTAPSLTIRIDSSGTGPSDHTSFYRKDIPVLFYFTGLHSDYHKPTDDADKINYKGEELIIHHIVDLIESLDSHGKLTFLKTRETQTTTSARFSVSMGIMPDYTFSGTGVRADGISEGKPAMKAGLKAGDIILQIGDYNTSSLENYMQALGKFKKGDKTKVKFKRGYEVMEVDVEF